MRNLNYAVPLPGNIKFDQIAFCAWDDEDEFLIKQFLQLEKADWIEDTVTARGQVGQITDAVNTAKLLFNYDFEMEVEILRYIEGPNYLSLSDMAAGRMSHIGSHFVGDGDVPRLDVPIIQQLVTQTHSNPFQAEHKRHYRYTIYNTLDRLGVFFKVIERLDR
jgi:hypothetical protein